MNIKDANGRTLNEICRALKRRRAKDGFTYRTRNSGLNDPSDPSTWRLPVYHGKASIISTSIVSYLRAFPWYSDALPQFGIDPASIFAEERPSYENKDVGKN